MLRLSYHTVLCCFQATDADLGVFGEIKYELYGSGISKYVTLCNDVDNIDYDDDDDGDDDDDNGDEDDDLDDDDNDDHDDDFGGDDLKTLTKT